MLEHDELDALLNGIDWDQPLSPLDLNLPTDPDNIALLSSSSLISPVALPNQPPNPLVDNLLQSLTKTPIHFTDHPANSKQVSRVNILLSSLYSSKFNLIKPNRRNHNLIPLHQDDSALYQQLWEHRIKTLGQLFHDQIHFSEISKLSTKAKRKLLSASYICQKALIQHPSTLPTN